MKPEIVQDISTRLKYAIKLRDISQAELARKTGIDKGSISLYMSGKYQPKSDKVYKLATALDVDPVWLSGFDVPMLPQSKGEMSLGSQIRKLRLQYGWSQTDLADKLNVSNAALCQYESGARTPDDALKIKMANLFNVSLDYLMGRDYAIKKQNKLPDNADELIDQVLKNKSNMAIVMGKGGDRKVIEVPEDAEAYIQSFIDTFNKKRDK